MNSASSGGGGSSSSSNKPATSRNIKQLLFQHLEKYLLDNLEKTYIDMEIMSGVLQKRNPTFGRMKQPVFLNMVKEAYGEYCQQHSAPGTEDPEPDDQPTQLLPIDSKPYSETINNGRKADSSDEYIDDEPYSNTMNEQLQMLYQSPIHGERTALPKLSRALSGFGSTGRGGGQAGSGIGRQSQIQTQRVTSGLILVNDFGAEEPAPRHESQIPIAIPQPPPPPTIRYTNTTTTTVFGVHLKQFDTKEDNRVQRNTIGRAEYEKDKASKSKLPIMCQPEKIPSPILGQTDRSEYATAANVTSNRKNSTGSASGPTPNNKIHINLKQNGNNSETSGSGTGSDLQILTEVKSPKKPEKTNPKANPTTPYRQAHGQAQMHLSTPTPNGGQKRKFAPDTPSSGSASDATGIERKKPRKELPIVQNSGISFQDFGGSEKVLEEICKLILHLKHPEMYRTLGVTPPRGFLLHGPPGCGKTLLANAIAGELGIPMIKMAATELISGISGESENNIRELFDQAVAQAPCIIFIDEIDSITPKRENAQREMERRIVAQLLACIDDLLCKENGDQVLLIGATNRIETIDIALRRAGRFDREICLGIPDINAREKILRVICKGLKLEDGFDYSKLAQQTPGYVGADLQALVREAAVQSVTEMLDEPTPKPDEVNNMEMEDNDDIEIVDEIIVSTPSTNMSSLSQRTPPTSQGSSSSAGASTWLKDIPPLTESQLRSFCLHYIHFEKALKNVQPSSKREGFATVPDTTWDSIGALKDIRDELQVSILGPVKHMAEFQQLGLDSPAGVLLCGPPGCGKTLLAKAVANEAGINFISVKGPELLNMYVGESERAVRQCFLRAKNSSPCVIFFDELDALCPRRSDGADGGSSSRVVNQLLTEMDGMESRLGVFVMAATNRPDIVDPAILRPGRLDKILFVNLPTPEDRIDILRAITKNGTKPTMGTDVDLDSVALRCDNFTGADLSSLIREASIASFREFVLDAPKEDGENVANLPEPRENKLKVYARHFEIGFTKTKPSVTELDRKKYNQMREKYAVTKTQ